MKTEPTWIRKVKFDMAKRDMTGENIANRQIQTIGIS